MIRDGNKLIVMLAGMYFAGGGLPLDEAVKFETRMTREMADAVAARHHGTVERVWCDPKAGGWFVEINLNPGDTDG